MPNCLAPIWSLVLKMRRSNIAKKHGSDLPSSVHDVEEGKVHRQRRTSKSTISIYLGIAFVALCTLVIVSKRVRTEGEIFVKTANGGIMVGKGKAAIVDSSSSATQAERFMMQQNRILPPDSIYRAKVKDIHGDWQQLMQYSGSVSLVVNVACEWGLTKSNYKELAILSDKYNSRGFNVLAFPSNDFHQETGTDEEILEYVNEHFPEVHFPIFSKSPLSSNMVFQVNDSISVAFLDTVYGFMS